MVYLALDTCVWIELLKVQLFSDHNEFDELFFWIDRKEITIITSENLNREWNRQKVDQFKPLFKLHKNLVSTMRINENASPYQENDYLEALIKNRIQRIDALLTTQAETAKEKTEIILESWQRCYERLAPNYTKESFRDTVNILCLLNHLKEKQIRGCFFTTINLRDFSAQNDKMKCHPQLQAKFEEVELEYVFFDSDMGRNKLFNFFLRKMLSDYTAYLSDKRRKDLEAKHESTRTKSLTVDIPEDEYLDNLQYIDTILSKRKLSSVDKQLIGWLINSHESYKKYFLRKVGENGLV